MRFENAEQMLNTITRDCIDLYSPELEEYVFLYTENGSICHYNIDHDEAVALAEMSDGNECWSGYLSGGGDIIDSLDWYEENGEEYNPDERELPIDYCRRMVSRNVEWIDTAYYTGEEETA